MERSVKYGSLRASKKADSAVEVAGKLRVEDACESLQPNQNNGKDKVKTIQSNEKHTLLLI